MPYFSSLQQFLDTVTARLTKPKRGVGGSEGVLATDVLEALKDTGKYTDDMRVVAQNALSTFNAVYDPALNAANQAALSAAAANALVTGVSTHRPSIRPSLLLDFTGEVLDPRITYTRSDSNKSYFDQKGVLRMAKANEWPREYDPVTGKCLGRSVWESRTNNCFYSEQFDVWSALNATVTANTTLAPSGTQVADTLTENTTNGPHYVSTGVLYTNGQAVTASCFMKAGTRTAAHISLYNGSITMVAYYNLATGTVIAADAGLTASIVSVGNGWYRVSCTYNSTVTAAGGGTFGGAISTSRAYQGDGVSTLHLWGAQVEAGNTASPYIPTTTTAATRLSETPYIDGVNFSDWYNANDGTILITGQAPARQKENANSRFFGLGDGTLSNYMSFYWNNIGSNISALQVLAGGVVQAAMTVTGADGSNVIDNNEALTISLAYKQNDFAGCREGTIQTDTAGNVPAGISKLYIGGLNQDPAFAWNGYISCLAYFPKRLPNTELQALTGSGLLAGKNPNQLPTVGDLGSAAFVQLRALLAMRNRQEFQILGTGTSQSYTIRRPYAFQFRTVDVPSGSTVTATPSTTVASSEDTDYTLTITVAVGKLFTYSITPIY